MKKTKKIKKILHHTGLSLHWSKEFIPNLVLVFGIVFVWRGLWNLIDLHFFTMDENLSNILSIIVGILLIYLPDGSFRQLGDFDPQDTKK